MSYSGSRISWALSVYDGANRWSSVHARRTIDFVRGFELLRTTGGILADRGLELEDTRGAASNSALLVEILGPEVLLGTRVGFLRGASEEVGEGQSARPVSLKTVHKPRRSKRTQ